MFILRRVPRPERTGGRSGGTRAHLSTVWRTLWPVVAVVAALLVAPHRIQTLVFIAALIAVCAALAASKRLSGREIAAIVKRIRTAKLAGLILAVYILRGMFLVSEAAVGLPEYLMTRNVPVALVCFFVPWIVGLLTGYTLAGIVTALPLLMGFIAPGAGDVRLGFLLLTYAGSFTGVLISPTHLCLTLTLEYFHTDFGRVFRYLIGPYLLVMAGVAVLGAVVTWLHPM